MRMRRAFSVAVNRILTGIRIMAAAASHLMTAEQFRKLPEDGWPPKREDRLGLPAPDGVNGAGEPWTTTLRLLRQMTRLSGVTVKNDLRSLERKRAAPASILERRKRAGLEWSGGRGGWNC